jgi:hypothetical protein
VSRDGPNISLRENDLMPVIFGYLPAVINMLSDASTKHLPCLNIERLTIGFPEAVLITG